MLIHRLCVRLVAHAILLLLSFSDTITFIPCKLGTPVQSVARPLEMQATPSSTPMSCRFFHVGMVRKIFL